MILTNSSWATSLMPAESRAKLAGSLVPYSFWRYGFGDLPGRTMLGSVDGNHVTLVPRTPLRSLVTTPFVGSLVGENEGTLLVGRVRVLRALLTSLLVSSLLGWLFVRIARSMGVTGYEAVIFSFPLIVNMTQGAVGTVLAARRVSGFVQRTLEAKRVGVVGQVRHGKVR